MNQDAIRLVTAKIEKALEMTRVLKSEKADLETLINGLRENLKEKDREIEELKNAGEHNLAEIRSLQEALNERDAKLDESESALTQAIEELDREFKLNIDIEQKNADSNRGFF